MYRPRVSVIIPTYNAGRFICQAVDSVLSQTYTDYEIIIVDDGSTDDTVQRLQGYRERLCIIRQDNQERSAARNTGIRHARGRYIAFLDADDHWAPAKLSKEIALLENNPGLDVVCSLMRAFHGNQMLPRIAGSSFEGEAGLSVFQGLLINRSLHVTLVARKERLEAIGAFDEKIVMIEDWDLWLRLSLYCRIAFIPEVLSYYRVSGKFLPAQMHRLGVHDTRIYAVQKAFAMAREKPPNVQIPVGLEAKALARAYWRSALILFAVQEIELAQKRWVQAIGYDPEFFFRTPSDWVESLLGFASSLYDIETPAAEAEEFVDTIFANVPEAASRLRLFHREAIGKLRAGYAFQARKKREFAAARRLMQRAVFYYPPLLRNRGVRSTCLYANWVPRVKDVFRRR